MRIFTLILLGSLWAFPLKAWPPIAGPQEAKLLVEIEEVRASLADYGVHEPSTNTSKLLIYMLGGYGLGASAASVMQLNSGNGEWLLTAFAGLGLGLGVYIGFEELPRILFKRIRLFQKIKSLADRSDRFASTREQFEKLVLDSAIAFYPVIELERLVNPLDRWIYLSMVHKITFKYAAYKEISLDLQRAFRIFYQSLNSLEIHAAKQRDLSAIYRSSHLRMHIVGFLGSMVKDKGWEAKKNLAMHLRIPIEALAAVTEDWNFEKSKNLKQRPKLQTYLVDFLSDDAKVRAELDLSGDGFFLRLPEELFNPNDQTWFDRFKKSPSEMMGGGFWIRFPNLDQRVWHFYRFEDQVFDKISSPLGHAELTLNPFDSQAIKILDWEDSFSDPKNFQTNILKRLEISQRDRFKAFCSKAIKAFF